MLDLKGKAFAQICYLFMLADGECSESERKRFAVICKKVCGVDANTREEIEESCEKIPLNEGPDNWRMAIREIGKVIEDEHLDCWTTKSERTTILWTLINLGYADKEYGESEKIVTNYVAKEFKIAPEDYFALQDIADTMVALEKQKEWLNNSTCTHAEYINEMSEIDKAMKRLEKSIKVIAEQADIDE